MVENGAVDRVRLAKCAQKIGTADNANHAPNQPSFFVPVLAVDCGGKLTFEDTATEFISRKDLFPR